MMTKLKLNDWLQVAGAVGVIAGLFLVAYEIRISNRLGFEQATANRLDRWTYLGQMNLEDDAAALFTRAHENDELSRDEALRLMYLMDEFLNTIRYEWAIEQTRADTFESGFNSFYRGAIQLQLGSEFGRRRWEVTKSAWNPDFAKIVDAALNAPIERNFIAEVDYVRGVSDRLD